jgi:hypothetical protein
MSAYERYLQSKDGGSSGGNGASLSPYQRFKQGITIQLPKPTLNAKAGGGSVDLSVLKDQLAQAQAESKKSSDFLKMPWWKQIFQPQVLNKDVLSQTVKEAPKVVAKKAVDFVKDTAKSTGTYQYAQDLYGATAGVKRYNKAVDQYVQQQDIILKKIRAEKNPTKKAKLFDILKEYQANAPKKEDFAPVLGKSNAQVIGSAALAGLELGGALPLGAGAEAASKAAPIFSRPLGQVLKETGARLLTKEGALAAGNTIGKEAVVGAGYNTLGAISQGATKPGEIAKSAAIGAATAPVLAGGLKLGARGVSELVAGQLKTPFKNETLYHGSEAGKLKVDNNGNINLTTDKAATERFGKTVAIPAKGLKVADVGTKENLFNIASDQKLKQEYINRGVDVISAENHQIAINPAKFSEKVNIPLREQSIRQKTVGELQAEATPFQKFTSEKTGQAIPKAEQPIIGESKIPTPSATKQYPTIHEGGKIKMVEGKPVKIVDGVDTFVHKGEGQFVVSEASTGRAIAAGNTEAGAIESAKFRIQDNGKTSLLRLIKEKKLTPEQLKQIPTETVAPESNIGVSKVAQSVNAKSIEKNLTTGFKDLAGYEKINIKDQAQRAANVLGDLNETRSILRGEKPVPSGLNEAMLLKAAEDHAYATKDLSLLQEIANSPLTSETSRSAQTLRILAEREPDSATAKIMELKKAREEAMLKKTKQRDAAKIVSEAKKEIQKKIKEAQPTRETWSSFIDSIKCK